MTQQYAPEDRRREAPGAQPDVLDQLERRRRELAAEQEAERKAREELAAVRGDIAAQDAIVQSRIDELLSSSPEDFVIRFLQTEGQ